MPPRRNRRSRRNRRPRRANARHTTQVSTGIPYSVKRISSDPPPLKLSNTQTVRVAFEINFELSDKDQPFSVKIGDTPFTPNRVYIRNTKSDSPQLFYLDQDEIFSAAAVMAHGVKNVAGSTLAIATEYALQSVTFYGPPGTSTRLGVDFGPGTPGGFITDDGSGTIRPVLKLVNPRLYWHRESATTSTDATLWASISGYRPLGVAVNKGTPTVNTFVWSAGRLDVVVQVRRSYFSQQLTKLIAKSLATE